MGILIIDGDSVFEIDEECLKKKKIAKECDIEKYFTDDKKKNNVKDRDRNNTF